MPNLLIITLFGLKLFYGPIQFKYCAHSVGREIPSRMISHIYMFMAPDLLIDMRTSSPSPKHDTERAQIVRALYGANVDNNNIVQSTAGNTSDQTQELTAYEIEALTYDAVVRCWKTSRQPHTIEKELRLTNGRTARLIGKSKSTIANYLKEIDKQMMAREITQPEEAYLNTSLGRPPVLTVEEEKAIVSAIYNFSTQKVPIDTMTFLHLAKLLGKDKFKDLPTKEWVRGFLRRHSEVKKRMPVDVDYHRVQWQSERRVTSFFSRFRSLLHERGIIGGSENKFGLIYNCDETGLKCIPTKSLCFAPAKEYQQVVVKKSLRRDDNHVTLHCCCSASGRWIPPLFIYKQKTASAVQLQFGENNAGYCHTEGGGMTSEAFFSWFQKIFVPNLPTRASDEYVVLLLDSHISHLYGPCLEFARENKIDIMTFPKDWSLFGSVKRPNRQRKPPKMKERIRRERQVRRREKQRMK